MTLGNPRKHVWTYATGFSDEGAQGPVNCPCDDTQGVLAHAFVGTNYYCESGRHDMDLSSSFHTSDPLWDGSECVGTENNCCADVSMPWFFRKFPIAQQDDVEVRICADQFAGDELMTVDQVQLLYK